MQAAKWKIPRTIMITAENKTKQNFICLQKAKSRGLGALLRTLDTGGSRDQTPLPVSPLPHLFPGPMEKVRFKG